MNTAQISFHRSILRTAPLSKGENESRLRNFRPISPAKIISNFLSGGPSKQHKDLPVVKSIPLIPPKMSLSRNAPLTVEQQSSKKMTVVGSNANDCKDTLIHLEDTLNTYLTALHSRSGNVVGKVLRNRATADELVVNELYNMLSKYFNSWEFHSVIKIIKVEDPSRIQATAEASVDVLFAAFEKFLNRAWKERMGPLLTSISIKNMQSALGI